jgi:hypothetical protein
MYPGAVVRRAEGKRIVWRAKVHVGDAGVPFLCTYRFEARSTKGLLTENRPDVASILMAKLLDID